MYVVIYRAVCERVAGSYKIKENNLRLGLPSPSTRCLASPTWKLHPPGSKQFAEKEYFCC